MSDLPAIYLSNPLSELGETDLIYTVSNPGETNEDDGAINKEDLFKQILTGMAYKLTTAISSNDLVLSLKDPYGDDFSAINVLRIQLYDTVVEINSALSVTKADATNWANLGSTELATQEVDLFAYLILETGASAGVKLGWSRIPYGTVVGDFSSTTTNEKYLAGPTNYNATDKVQNIGRFNAVLSAGAGYTWSLPATSVIVNTLILSTRWLDWTPTHSRSGGAYSNNPTINSAKYKIVDDVLKVSERHTQHATPGSSGHQLITMPFTNPQAVGVPAPAANATVPNTCQAFWQPSVTTVSVFKYDGTVEATASQAYSFVGDFLLQ